MTSQDVLAPTPAVMKARVRYANQTEVGYGVVSESVLTRSIFRIMTAGKETVAGRLE